MYVNFDIPEIEKFQNGFPQYWIKVLFIGSFSGSYQLKALATTYIRLVEAALVEYRLGKVKLKEFWDTHESLNLGAMNRSVSHFESCLTNTHRAIRCFTRFRRHKDLPVGLRAIFSLEKPLFINSYIYDKIRDIRNKIHHLEEIVMKGSLQQGQSFTLSTSGPEIPHPTEPNQTIKTIDRLSIARRELLFKDLSVWLTEMGVYADKIASYKEQDA